MRRQIPSLLAALGLVLTLAMAPGCDGCGGDEAAETGDDQGSAAEEAGQNDEAADDEAAGDEEGEAPKAERAGANEKGEADEAAVDAEPGDALASARARREEARAARKGADGAAESDKGEAVAPVDAATKRRQTREKRRADLKARNDARKQDRVAKLAERNGVKNPAGRGEAAIPAGGDADAASKSASTKPAPVVNALKIDKYLTLNDVRRITGDRTLAAAGSLDGQVPHEGYNSRYFARPVRARFGLSMQVWQGKTRRDTNERFHRMQTEYPNAEGTTAVTPLGFFSYWDKIMTLTFADISKRIIVSVSCSEGVCNQEELFNLAMAVKARIR